MSLNKLLEFIPMFFMIYTSKFGVFFMNASLQWNEMFLKIAKKSIFFSGKKTQCEVIKNQLKKSEEVVDEISKI